MSHQQQIKNISRPENQHDDNVAAGPPNVESPQIFKLSIECFNKIFEYCDLRSLHLFSQTCRRMHKLAGLYFEANYGAATKIVRIPGIYMNQYTSFYGPTDISSFEQFMPAIQIDGVTDTIQLRKLNL